MTGASARRYAQGGMTRQAARRVAKPRRFTTYQTGFSQTMKATPSAGMAANGSL